MFEWEASSPACNLFLINIFEILQFDALKITTPSSCPCMTPDHQTHTQPPWPPRVCVHWYSLIHCACDCVSLHIGTSSRQLRQVRRSLFTSLGRGCSFSVKLGTLFGDRPGPRPVTVFPPKWPAVATRDSCRSSRTNLSCPWKWNGSEKGLMDYIFGRNSVGR